MKNNATYLGDGYYHVYDKGYSVKTKKQYVGVQRWGHYQVQKNRLGILIERGLTRSLLVVVAVATST